MAKTTAAVTKEVERSKNFDKYKSYYDSHMWTKKMLYNVVAKGAITAEEYEEITGEAFLEE